MIPCFSSIADGYLFATHGDRCFYLGKSARDRLHWLKENPGKWRHVPHNAGVLVIGGDVTKKPEYDTTASVKARKWKSFSRKFREAKT